MDHGIPKAKNVAHLKSQNVLLSNQLRQIENWTEFKIKIPPPASVTKDNYLCKDIQRPCVSSIYVLYYTDFCDSVFSGMIQWWSVAFPRIRRMNAQTDPKRLQPWHGAFRGIACSWIFRLSARNKHKWITKAIEALLVEYLKQNIIIDWYVVKTVSAFLLVLLHLLVCFRRHGTASQAMLSSLFQLFANTTWINHFVAKRQR